MSDALSNNSSTSNTTSNYRTFQYLHTLEGGVIQNDRLVSFPFGLTPDSQRLIIVELNETLAIWDLRTGFLQTLPSDQPNSDSYASAVEISSDGKRSYIVYESATFKEPGAWVQIQDTTTGQVLERFNTELTRLRKLAINIDETLLALWANDRKEIEVWDLQNKRFLYQRKSLNHSIRSIRFSLDGQLLLVWTHGGLEVCESQTGTPLYTPENSYRGLHLSSDGETALGIDKEDLIHQWNLRTGDVIQRWPVIGFSNKDKTRLFSPDGNVLVSVSFPEGEIKLWDWRTDELLSTMPTNNCREDEPWLDGIIPREWRGASGYRGTGHPVYKMRFTADGRFMVTSGGDGTIRIWGSLAKEPTVSFRYPHPNIGKRIETLRKWTITDAFAGMFE